MRRAAIAVMAGALATALAPAASAAELQVSRGAAVQFPTRSLVLTLPVGTALTPSQVSVTENGKPVPNLTVTGSTATTSKHFGVVLLIDASPRMRRSIDSAMAAARAFAAHRNPHHPLAVIAFNHTSTSLVGLTYSRDEIEDALAKAPPLDNERHLYDATSGAIALLRRGHGINGSVVVMSDGADKGSKLTAPDVVAQARAAGIRVYTVGIPDIESFDGSSLQDLASGTDADYVTARTQSELTGALDKLGRRIASEYLVGYRSLAGPRTHVNVRVAVDGLGSDTLSYTTPALRRYAGNTVAKDSFVRSTGAMVLVALLCAGLVGLGVALLLRPDPEGVRARVAQFVPGSVAGVEDEPILSGSGRGGRAPVVAEEVVTDLGWWPSLKRDMEIARIEIPAAHVAIVTVAATALAFVFLLAISGSLVLALLALLVPLAVRGAIQRRLQQQRSAFAAQIADSLQVVASAMRVGQSFSGALSVAVEEAGEPTRSELEHALVDEQLGIPLEVGLQSLADRMNSPDVSQLALVATVQRETGGNTAEVIDRVTESIREHAELRGLVQTLTAQGRLSRWILTLLPVGLFFTMITISPGYMDPLLHTSTGHALLALCIVLIVAGSLVIKRIVEIEV